MVSDTRVKYLLINMATYTRNFYLRQTFHKNGTAQNNLIDYAKKANNRN